MKTVAKNWLIITAFILAFFAVLDFEYLKFTVLDWFGKSQRVNMSSYQEALTTAPTTASSTTSQTAPSKAQSGTINQKTRQPETSPFVLTIPSLNISVPIVYVYDATEKEFQAGLKDGVVLYQGTALPGRPGNTYIFGHSSDYIWNKGNYKTVLADLSKIKLGEEIWLSDFEGNAYVYIAMESFVAGPKDLHFLSQETGGKKILTLQTSWPLGTALKRWIVKAEIKTP